jgi:hypothetical protein
VRATIALIFMCGCATEHGTLMERFSEDTVCPKERVEVHELASRTTTLRRRNPPPQVMLDPERLALWNEMRDRDQERHARAGQLYTWYQAVGCGDAKTYRCYHKKWQASCEPSDVALQARAARRDQ